MVERKTSVLLLVAGLICLVSIIMSLYSISTAAWSTVGLYTVGLFQTCSNSQCATNQYETYSSGSNSPPIFARRLFNAAPLSIVSVFIQLIVCFLSFLTAFIYLPPKPLITCYITPTLAFVAFLFQFVTITEASYGLHLNGRSATVFESALVLQIVVLVLTVLAADRIRRSCNFQYV